MGGRPTCYHLAVCPLLSLASLTPLPPLLPFPWLCAAHSPPQCSITAEAFGVDRGAVTAASPPYSASASSRRLDDTGRRLWPTRTTGCALAVDSVLAPIPAIS